MTTQAETKRPLELPAIVALALAGAAIGVGVVRLDGFGPKTFSDSGQFRLWLFLIAAQTALFAIAAAYLVILAHQKSLEGAWTDARGAVVAYVVAAAVPLYGFLVVVYVGTRSSKNPLPDRPWKLLGLYTLGTTIALIGVAVFALIRVCLQNDDSFRYVKSRSDHICNSQHKICYPVRARRPSAEAAQAPRPFLFDLHPRPECIGRPVSGSPSQE